jgi:hypothetical protein
MIAEPAEHVQRYPKAAILPIQLMALIAQKTNTWTGGEKSGNANLRSTR